MAEIYDKSVEFRDALLQRERQAASILVRSYGQSWNKIQKLLARVTSQVDDAQRRGLPISPAWLFQQERYQQLILQIEREITKFAHVLDAQVKKEQSAAIRAAARNTVELAAAAQTPGVSAGFTKLSPPAIESITAFVQEGTPLGRLLTELPRGAGKAVADALTEAVTLGYNPVKTARIIRREMGMTLTRALTIARTETLRAYREATHRSYQANDDIVQGWIWVASMSRRTCVSCLALHGQWFPMTERQSSHPRCRCTSIPALKGDPNPITESGEAWLKRQPEDIQRTVIGTKAGFDRFKNGELTLQDFVGLQRSPQWGDSYVQLSVKRALNGEARFPKFTPPTMPAAPTPAPFSPLATTSATAPAFTPAKTIKEAEEWAVTQGIAKQVTYDGLRLEDVNRVNESLARIWQEWKLTPMDVIANDISRTHTQASANGWRIRFNQLLGDAEENARSFRGAVTDFQSRWKMRLEYLEMRPNPALWQEQIAKARETLKYSRWFAHTDASRYVEETFIHEAGHVLSDKLLGKLMRFNIQDPTQLESGSEGWKLLEEWKAIYANRGDDVYKISQYADANDDEFFAESFLMYNKERNKLPARIVDYFDRLKKYANERPLPKL